jgi:hypothetical protein
MHSGHFLAGRECQFLTRSGHALYRVATHKLVHWTLFRDVQFPAVMKLIASQSGMRVWPCGVAISLK